MTDKQANFFSWYLVTIDDAPKYLPGKSIFDLIRLLCSVINFKFVVTDCIEGFGKYGAVLNFQRKSDTVIKLNEVLQFLCDVHQFEWGDFFLFKEYPQHWSNPEGELYPFVVAQSDTTIRAVDNQYMYIYTPYQEIVDIIKNNYTIEEIKSGNLDSLDYPE